MELKELALVPIAVQANNSSHLCAPAPICRQLALCLVDKPFDLDKLR